MFNNALADSGNWITPIPVRVRNINVDHHLIVDVAS